MRGATGSIHAGIGRITASMLGIAAALALLATAGCVPMQTVAPLARPQLDSLMAPIALYPDPLLADMVMAATYPGEVAAAWRQSPANAALGGAPLVAASAAQPWDPSVKSLLPFPAVLQWIAANPQWLQQLGDAFLVQQDDVTASVQRLRHLARAAGTLKSTPQQTVAVAGDIVTIAPASPRTVYMPIYNPAVAYGTWPYPQALPYALPPPSGHALGPGIGFGTGYAVVDALWGWSAWDWRLQEIRIDRDAYDRMAGWHGHAGSDVRSHGFHAEAGAQRLAPPPGPVTRDGFRGFPAAASSAAPGPPAFQSFDGRAEVRAAVARGEESRASTLAPMRSAAARGGIASGSSNPPGHGSNAGAPGQSQGQGAENHQ